MVELTCVACGKKFSVRQYRAKKAKFCGRDCRKGYPTGVHPSNVFPKGNIPWNKGIEWEAMKGNQYAKGNHPENTFEKGHTPWNKGVKGLHHSPATEFKKGRVSNTIAPVGEVRERTHRGVVRRFVKIADPNTWIEESTHVWVSAHGSVPPGHVIHHVDHNPLNNAITNLQCLSRSQHATTHLLSRHRGQKENLFLT